MTAFQNLRDQYLGQVVSDVADSAYQGTKRVFSNIFAEKPAEYPPLRTTPQPLPMEEPPQQYQPPQQYPNPQYPQYQQNPQPQQNPQYQQQPQYPIFGVPYMPPPPAPRYKVDEEKMRSMAKWKATVNLKYVETLSSFARSMVGNMAATNAMVELVERLDRNDTTLTDQDREMAPTIRKAVEKRRAIERAKTKILSDEDMRNIYEELIFQEMWDSNERGELRLESPNDFLRNYVILTGAEILESGKEVIGDKVSGVFGTLKNKFSKK